MKVGIILLCRYSSSRLPGKILMKIGGDTLLNSINERLNRSKHNLPLIVATSSHSSDNIIEDYCLRNGMKVFRGPLDNVAERFLTCAKVYNLDYAIRINGDNLFTDPNLVDEMVDIAISKRYDFITNVEGRTFPHGMSVEILRIAFYSEIFKKFTKDSWKEHVTLYLYENPKVGTRFNFKNLKCPFNSQIQLAIDNSGDVEMAESIIRSAKKPFIELTYCDIIEIYKSFK